VSLIPSDFWSVDFAQIWQLLCDFEHHNGGL
jgi:hypothetical protein